MTNGHTILIALSLCLAIGFMSSCTRDQDTSPPAGQQQGQSKPQDYPSTRNMEQPNPGVGGDNSAINRPSSNQNTKGSASSQTTK
jgi:hypothetical protein